MRQSWHHTHRRSGPSPLAVDPLLRRQGAWRIHTTGAPLDRWIAAGTSSTAARSGSSSPLGNWPRSTTNGIPCRSCSHLSRTAWHFRPRWKNAHQARPLPKTAWGGWTSALAAGTPMASMMGAIPWNSSPGATGRRERTSGARCRGSPRPGARGQSRPGRGSQGVHAAPALGGLHHDRGRLEVLPTPVQCGMHADSSDGIFQQEGQRCSPGHGNERGTTTDSRGASASCQCPVQRSA